MAEPPGRLILVVGPSGVGKDSLIDGARSVLADKGRFVFPRRDITRPVEAGGENHVAVDREMFDARRQSGDYALWWEAHGLGYGIPATIRTDIEKGRDVIVNVSRTVLDEARKDFPNVLVPHVTAPAALIAQRLTARGRETGAAIGKRLDRGGAYRVEGADVVEVLNDADLSQGIDRFLAALRARLPHAG